MGRVADLPAQQFQRLHLKSGFLIELPAGTSQGILPFQGRTACGRLPRPRVVWLMGIPLHGKDTAVPVLYNDLTHQVVESLRHRFSPHQLHARRTAVPTIAIPDLHVLFLSVLWTILPYQIQIMIQINFLYGSQNRCP